MPSTTKLMKNCKRLLVLFLTLILFWGNALAANTDSSLTLGVISISTQFMNPLIPVEREFMSLNSLVYEGLVELDDDYLPRPKLCRSWEASAGGGTWYFYLREGITFHDGTPLTANDVVATVKTILDLANNPASGNAGAYSSLQYFITDISANDNLTVVIKTNRTNFGFLYAMTFPILPASQVQAENPVGTGPYKVDQFVPKDFLILSAYDSWWKGKAAMNTIMTIFHAANRELMSSFEYNRVDAVATRSLTAAQYRSGISSLNLSYRTKQLETLMMNNRVRELKDVRVRKAIRHAINIQDILSSVYMDMAQRTDTPMMPGTWMHSDIPEAFQYDPEKAKQLLDEAGWVDSDGDGIRDTVIDGNKANLRLRFLIYEEQDNSVRMMAANKIAGMLKSIGIDTTPTLISFSEVRDRLKAGNYDIALASFNMDTVPDPGFLLMTNNTANYMRYSSTEMDNLFKHLRTRMTQEEYRNTLFQIQSLFAEDCPFICLYYRKGAILTRKMFTDARDLREPDVLRGIAEGLEKR